MAWRTTAPDGSKSVKDNETILQDNTTYTETTMNYDHYWNIGSNEDGRHKYVNMPNQASAPSISTGMNGILYALENVSTQPYFRNNDSIMQLLGIRAMAVFNGTGALAYNYNVASVSRTSTGNYTITYTSALPNNNYLVLGGSIRNDSTARREAILTVQAATSISDVKSTALVKVITQSFSNTAYDPLQVWVVCFGG